MNKKQQQVLAAYLNAAAAYHDYRRRVSVDSLMSVAEIDADARIVDVLLAESGAAWDACRAAGIPTATLDAAVEQRFGRKVNR